MGNDRYDINVTVSSKDAKKVESTVSRGIAAAQAKAVDQLDPKVLHAFRQQLSELERLTGRAASAVVKVPVEYKNEAGKKRTVMVGTRVHGDLQAYADEHVKRSQLEMFNRQRHEVAALEERARAAGIDPNDIKVGVGTGVAGIRRVLSDSREMVGSAAFPTMMGRARASLGEFKRGLSDELRMQRGDLRLEELVTRSSDLSTRVRALKLEGAIGTAERKVEESLTALRAVDRAHRDTPQYAHQFKQTKALVSQLERSVHKATGGSLARDTSLIAAIGGTASFRSLSTGVQGIAGGLLGGNYTQLPGMIMHTVGAVMQNMGLSRMAIARRRTAGDGGAAAAAGPSTHLAPLTSEAHAELSSLLAAGLSSPAGASAIASQETSRRGAIHRLLAARRVARVLSGPLDFAGRDRDVAAAYGAGTVRGVTPLYSDSKVYTLSAVGAEAARRAGGQLQWLAGLTSALGSNTLPKQLSSTVGLPTWGAGIVHDSPWWGPESGDTGPGEHTGRMRQSPLRRRPRGWSPGSAVRAQEQLDAAIASSYEAHGLAPDGTRQASKGAYLLPPGMMSAVQGAGSAVWGGVKRAGAWVGNALGVGGGMGLALGGMGLMAAGKLVTAGLERGYANSADADKYMAMAEPFFARRQMEYIRAHGGRYGRAGMLDSSFMTGATPIASLVAQGKSEAYQNTIIARIAAHGDAAIAALDNPMREGRASITTSRGSWRKDLVPQNADTTELSAQRANDATRELMVLGRHGMGRQEAFQAYASFTNTSGVAGRGMRKDVELINYALANGLSPDLAANMVRLASHTGEGSGSLIGISNALTNAGISGAPRAETTAALIQQMLGEEAAGFTPSTYAAGNFTGGMLGSGMRHSAVPRLRGTFAGMRDSIYAPFQQMGQQIVQMNMMANAFRGRSFFEGMDRLATASPEEQGVLGFAGLNGSARSLALRSLAPGQSTQLDAAMRTLAGADMTAVPAANEAGLFGFEGMFARAQAMATTDWNLIGKERNVDTIAAGEAFKAALDDAADVLRKLADRAIDAASVPGGWFGINP